MSQEFLDYFDHDAFSDHAEWSACYCLESHLSQPEEEACQTKEARRQKAKELIQQGIMNGYLLYDGRRIVGWCNAGDKVTYQPLWEDPFFSLEAVKPGQTKVLYCIDIAPDYRGKGLANRVMEQFLADAKQEGCSYAEGYPFSDHDFPYQYKGPFRLYQTYGFTLEREGPQSCVMRKKL